RRRGRARAGRPASTGASQPSRASFDVHRPAAVMASMREGMLGSTARLLINGLGSAALTSNQLVPSTVLKTPPEQQPVPAQTTEGALESTASAETVALITGSDTAAQELPASQPLSTCALRPGVPTLLAAQSRPPPSASA